MEVVDDSFVAPRTIIESSVFEKSKQLVQPDAKHLDDALIGVTFAIARKPDEFDKDEKTGIQIAKTRKTPDTPALTIYFRNQVTTIELLDIEVTNDGDGQ